MTLEGIDLASHQGDYTYPTNPDFAIPKASGGHAYRNPYLAQQVANARAKGILLHFYHYMFEPTSGGGDVNLEAQNFIEAVRPYVQPGSAFWLDVEEYPATVGFTGDLGGWIDTFCDLVNRAFGADCCGIYCATWYLIATGLNTDARLAKRRFWMASWQQAIPAAHYMAPWDHLTLHQYNADGIDKDRFYGTREAFLALGVPDPAKVIEKKTDTATADPIVARSYINAKGQPVTEIVWAGQAVEVLGTDYVDIGIRVKNAAGQVFHRSILNGQGQQYVEEE